MHNLTNRYEMIARLRKGMLAITPTEGSIMSLNMSDPTVLFYGEKNVFLAFLNGSVPTIHPKQFYNLILRNFLAIEMESYSVHLACVWLLCDFHSCNSVYLHSFILIAV